MPLENRNLEANQEKGINEEHKKFNTHWEVSVSFHTEAAAKIFIVFLKSKPIGGHNPKLKEVAD